MFNILKTNREKIAAQQAQLNEMTLLLDEANDKIQLKRDLVATKEEKIHDLNKQIDRIESKKKITVDEMKQDRKLHDQELEHMVKIKIESLEIEHDKKVVALERSEAAAIAEVKDEYRDKVEKELKDRNVEMKNMYSEVLERLPNLNASMHLGGSQKEANKD